MLGIIFNPHARKNLGHAERRLRALREAAGPEALIEVTSDVHEIRAALERFAAAAVCFVVCDGGDGAVHWVVNEAIALWGVDEAARRFVYMPSSAGTIDFMAAALGLRGGSLRLVGRLAEAIREGRQPRLVPLRTVDVQGTRAVDGEEVPFHRYAWAVAAAGMGANFYGPWYRSRLPGGPVRIVGLLGLGFAAAGARSALSGPLDRLRGQKLRQLEHDFLREMPGEVLLDGAPFVDRTGRRVESFNVVHAGSVHVNLGNVLKVFGDADDEHIHVHVGHLTPLETFVAVTDAARNRRFSTPRIYDGPARTLELRPAAGHELIPCLDGELFPGVRELRLAPGPEITFCHV